MSSRVGFATIVVAASSLVFASSGAAQFRVELGATIARYSPLGSFDEGSAHSIGGPREPGDLSGAALGGELRIWVAPRVGFSLSGSSASSDVGGGELGLTAMLYSVNMSAPSLAFGPGVFERGRQADLLLRTGVSYTIH